jgi:hypothetical protein
MDRLPETVATLYAELLDQCLRSDVEARVAAGGGSFVSKQIRGNTYWYFQQTNGAAKRQKYLGRETPELLKTMSDASAARSERNSDADRRRELVRMLISGGVVREAAPAVQALSILAEAGMFRGGGVLVGTQAFACYANMLGVRFEQQYLRTADVDIAVDLTVAFQAREESSDVPAALRKVEPRFFFVPELDPREPSTSMKVRGRDLRIDFLTTLPTRGKSAPVPLPQFRIAAAPLKGIEYLIEETVPAVVVGGSGVLVHVPTPARFAFHKLWVSRDRPVSEQVKARKDVAQALAVLSVLAEDRPGDITEAWRALEKRPGMIRNVRVAIRSLPAELRDRVTA